MSIKVGDLAPDFEVSVYGYESPQVALSDLRGKWVVLYFYPKDMTSGCTTEANDFQAHLEEFKKLGALVIGASKDSITSHEKFASKYGLMFPLLADTEVDISTKYGIYKEKKMYGKSYMGIERTTFLIDQEGKIAKIYPKVKISGHVQEVLDDLNHLV